MSSDTPTPAAERSVAPSPSTELLRGTMLVQSSPAPVPAAAASASHSRAPSSRSPLVEYRGDADGSGSSASASSSSSSSARPAARRPVPKAQSREELRAAFSVFDSAGVGSITTGEFSVVYKMLVAGVSDAELAEVVAALDDNGDGQISFDEFASLMHRRAQAASSAGAGASVVDDALSVFDTGDPRVTRLRVDEVMHICDLLKAGLTDDEREELMKQMHVEADGSINYARLVQQMMPGGAL